MNGFARVLEVNLQDREAHVAVYPASCGRCDEPGHCTRRHRQMWVNIPAEMTVTPGEIVRLGTPRDAVYRGIGQLFILPAAAAAGGYLVATAIVSSPAIAGGISAAAAAAPVLYALIRGARREDRPFVVQRLSSPPEGSFTELSLHL